MNLISSNILKRLCALILCVCMLLCITACGEKNTKNIKDVDQICVTGSYTESWMNVYTDEAFVNEMVEIYNSVEYVETDKDVDVTTAGEVLFFTFNNGNDEQAKFIVDKNSVFTFEAGTQCYEITSEFDFEYVKSLVDEQKKKTLKESE